MEPLPLIFCSFSIFTLVLFFTVKIFSKLIHDHPSAPSESLSSWLCSCFPSQHLPSLQGKHVFITGASSGIGLAIAKSSIQQGAFVTMVARRLHKLQEASKKLVEDTQCGRDRIHIQVFISIILLHKHKFCDSFLTNLCYLWYDRFQCSGSSSP